MPPWILILSKAIMKAMELFRFVLNYIMLNRKEKC